MMPSPRPRSTRQAFAALQFALSSVARPTWLVVAWRWRYELVLATGLPASVVASVRSFGYQWALAGIALFGAVVTVWPPVRRFVVARARCVITPHRIRAGCAQAWIHSRRGKLPIILMTRQAPLGERIHLWCRAGTSIEDITSARSLLISACWAHDIRVTRHPRYAHLVTIYVIRRPEDVPGRWPDASPRRHEMEVIRWPK